MTCWVGVDVGGRRKGFDVAVIDERRLLALHSHQSVRDVVALVASSRPAVVAIDSPRSCAPPGATHREDERALRAAVCGIRWTPPGSELDGNPYYEWIVQGLELYDALGPLPVEAIECFPTAAWTRWYGPRNGRSRAAWSSEALHSIDLQNLPDRTNQDERDAIAAALTARAYSERQAECFGEIVVPALRSPA
jgi:predicted nuclease with RNAse H fold